MLLIYYCYRFSVVCVYDTQLPNLLQRNKQAQVS